MKTPKIQRLGKSIVAAGACVVLTHPVFAHETWLMPDTFQPAPDTQVSLSMTSGMAFPKLGAGIIASRIEEAVLSQNGERNVLVVADTAADALQLIAAPDAGTACVWVSIRPRILDIKPDAVTHYLDEIGASEASYKAWEAQSEPRYWKESYSKLARTYLRGTGDSAAAADTGDCWSDASDSRFEILPLVDPTRLKTGDQLPLQLMFDGEPLANQAVGLWRAGDEPNAMQRSDGDGRLTLTFEDGGRHMIYATHLRPQMGEGFNWESNFVTLTLQVGQE